jgi:hypothetical protein
MKGNRAFNGPLSTSWTHKDTMHLRDPSFHISHALRVYRGPLVKLRAFVMIIQPYRHQGSTPGIGSEVRTAEEGVCGPESLHLSERQFCLVKPEVMKGS